MDKDQLKGKYFSWFYQFVARCFKLKFLYIVAATYAQRIDRRSFSYAHNRSLGATWIVSFFIEWNILPIISTMLRWNIVFIRWSPLSAGPRIFFLILWHQKRGSGGRVAIPAAWKKSEWRPSRGPFRRAPDSRLFQSWESVRRFFGVDSTLWWKNEGNREESVAPLSPPDQCLGGKVVVLNF